MVGQKCSSRLGRNERKKKWKKAADQLNSKYNRKSKAKPRVKSVHIRDHFSIVKWKNRKKSESCNEKGPSQTDCMNQLNFWAKTFITLRKIKRNLDNFTFATGLETNVKILNAEAPTPVSIKKVVIETKCQVPFSQFKPPYPPITVTQIKHKIIEASPENKSQAVKGRGTDGFVLTISWDMWGEGGSRKSSFSSSEFILKAYLLLIHENWKKKLKFQQLKFNQNEKLS